MRQNKSRKSNICSYSEFFHHSDAILNKKDIFIIAKLKNITHQLCRYEISYIKAKKNLIQSASLIFQKLIEPVSLNLSLPCWQA